MRMSDRVADQILEGIIARGVRIGERLPTEKVLAEQFGVSRTVIREAVRSLVGKGMIDARPGRGLSVTAPGASAAQQSMTLFLRGRVEHDYRKVSEVRRMVEVEIAGLAAQRATDAEIAQLRSNCDRMAAILDENEAASQVDLEFHSALARATHNELHLVMLDAISDSLLEIRRSTFHEPGRAGIALAAHRAILERIDGRDASGARASMRTHLDDVEHAWEVFNAAQAADVSVAGASADT